MKIKHKLAFEGLVLYRVPMFGFETCFPTVTHFVAVLVVLMIAEIVYVMLGFGAGLIAVGSLAVLFPDIRDVVVMLLVVNIPAEIVIILKERKNIQWKGLLLIMAGIVVGVPIGTWILKITQPTFLLPILGGLLVVFGLFFFFAGGKLEKLGKGRLLKWFEPPAGAMAGILAGLFGTGGPPLIVYFQIKVTPKNLFRANLMACFFLFAVLRTPSYIVTGLLTRERLISSLLVFPAVALGALIGHRIHVSMSEDRFKKIVSLCIAIVGVVLLVS